MGKSGFDSVRPLVRSPQEPANWAEEQFRLVVEGAPNGIVMVDRGRARTVAVGEIERRNVAVHISDAFGDMNVIGMNFLSSLSGWSVEGRTLVLRA
jgi:predicted aspartyl protease